jgi:hypothetical protein
MVLWKFINVFEEHIAPFFKGEEPSQGRDRQEEEETSRPNFSLETSNFIFGNQHENRN